MEFTHEQCDSNSPGCHTCTGQVTVTVPSCKAHRYCTETVRFHYRYTLLLYIGGGDQDVMSVQG